MTVICDFGCGLKKKKEKKKEEKKTAFLSHH